VTFVRKNSFADAAYGISALWADGGASAYTVSALAPAALGIANMAAKPKATATLPFI
jgi:hypothetical protein